MKMLCVDAAFRNVGWALVTVNLKTMSVNPLEIGLVRTELSKNKTVRAASDKLRRAREIALKLRALELRAEIMTAEIPSGAQSAAAAAALGIAIGILSGHTVPLIEVTPAEVKLAALGSKTASKREMIDWAAGTWPDLEWITARGKLTDANEHMADAIAIAHAGVNTPEFRQAAVFFQPRPASAA